MRIGAPGIWVAIWIVLRKRGRVVPGKEITLWFPEVLLGLGDGGGGVGSEKWNSSIL